MYIAVLMGSISDPREYIHQPQEENNPVPDDQFQIQVLNPALSRYFCGITCGTLCDHEVQLRIPNKDFLSYHVNKLW